MALNKKRVPLYIFIAAVVGMALNSISYTRVWTFSVFNTGGIDISTILGVVAIIGAYLVHERKMG